MSYEENATDTRIAKNHKKNLGKRTENTREEGHLQETSCCFFLFENWKYMRGGFESHLPESSSGLVQLVGKHFEEGYVQECSTSNTLSWVCRFFFSDGDIYRKSGLVDYRKVSWSQFNTWRTPLHISWGREGGRSERAMPRFRKM